MCSKYCVICSILLLFSFLCSVISLKRLFFSSHTCSQKNNLENNTRISDCFLRFSFYRFNEFSFFFLFRAQARALYSRSLFPFLFSICFFLIFFIWHLFCFCVILVVVAVHIFRHFLFVVFVVVCLYLFQLDFLPELRANFVIHVS